MKTIPLNKLEFNKFMIGFSDVDLFLSSVTVLV